MNVTIKQVASTAHLSKSTISKYLNGGNVEPRNREVIEKVIHELGFSPNLVAKGLKTSRTFTVGVMLPFINDVFSATIVAGMERSLQEKGYGVIVCGYEGDRAMFKKKLNFLFNKMIDSLVIFPSGISNEDVVLPQTRKIPVVLVDRPLEGLDCDVVMTDNEDACEQAVQYLVDCGHKRIAVLTGAKTSYTSGRRINGCRSAFRKNGLEDNEKLIRFGVSTPESGFRNMLDLLDGEERPTAVIATNYYITFGALNALNARRLEVPEELSFVGFDTTELYKLFRVPLTTVEQGIEQLGIRSAELILRRLSGDWTAFPSRVVLRARIVFGDSVKKI